MQLERVDGIKAKYTGFASGVPGATLKSDQFGIQEKCSFWISEIVLCHLPKLSRKFSICYSQLCHLLDLKYNHLCTASQNKHQLGLGECLKGVETKLYQ